MIADLGFMGATLAGLLIAGLGLMHVVTGSVNQGSRAGLLSGLGLVETAVAPLTDSAHALLTASIGSRFTRGLLRGSMLRHVSGSVYLGLGLCTALISRQH